MENITKNEMLFILGLFKDVSKEHNAASMANEIGITRMGGLKIARRLEEERILKSREMGNAKFYSINLDGYTKKYIAFLLKREAEQSEPFIKRWVIEVRKIKSAALAILFGSVLNKKQKARDVDVLLIVDKKNFDSLEEEIKNINLLNNIKLHPIYQTKEDFVKNISKKDKIILNALKGIVAFGEDYFVEIMKNEPG